MSDIDKWVEVLATAERARQLVSPITEQGPDFGVEQAYAVQAALVARRVAAGERVVGAKLGLTSKAKQIAMGVDCPIFGVLTDGMQLALGEPIPLGGLIHPRAEPEIAFLISQDISGVDLTINDILDATEGICAAVEIIDSRYHDFRFTLPDVIADNTSAARFILGPTVAPPRALDLALVGVVLEKGGVVVDTATGAAVLGHPAVAVTLLAKELTRRGEAIAAGSVVLSGGMTNAVPLSPADELTATFARLGRIDLRVG